VENQSGNELSGVSFCHGEGPACASLAPPSDMREKRRRAGRGTTEPRLNESISPQKEVITRQFPKAGFLL